MLAPLTFVALNGDWLPRRLTGGFRGAGFAAAAILNIAIILYFGTYDLVEKNIKPFGGIWRAQPETARLLRVVPFWDDAETVIENIVGREIPHSSQFRSIYIWNVGGGKSFWVLTGRAMSATEYVKWNCSSVPAYRACPPNDLFVMRDGQAVISRSVVTNYADNPKVGEYVMVLMDSVPETVTANCDVVVRREGDYADRE